MKTLPLILLSLAIAAADAFSAERPNIVFILADDLGWSDLGVQGSGYYQTPAIDRMASQGLRFDAFYVCQNCAPTRAAIMSGQYAPRTGVYTVASGARGRAENRRMNVPENVTKLPLDIRTVADVMKSAGYATGMFGKWHLGNDPEHHPSSRGFDEAVVSNGRHFAIRTNPDEDVPEDVYFADWLADHAVDFIRRHRDEPFFLYLPHFGVHTPHHAKADYIEAWKDREPSGRHDSPVYAAMIQSIDESVGAVDRVLEELDLAENTVVIFASDNGGVGGYYSSEPPSERRGITDNAPLRGGKGTLYEGGIRVPFIVRWPGEIPAGSTTATPGVHVDLLPTFAALAGADLPDQPLDGVSLVDLFKNPDAALPRDSIFFHFPGYLESYVHRPDGWRTTPVGVIRQGDFKLLEFFENDRLELYNLREDIGERVDLAAAMPDKAAAMRNRLAEWCASVDAPMPTLKSIDAGPFFANGMKIGEVTQTGAIIWTRLTAVEHGDPTSATHAAPGADGSVALKLKASNGSVHDFGRMDAKSESDFVCQFAADGLSPATSYEIELTAFEDSGEPSAALTGRFRTAPEADAKARVRGFVVSCQGIGTVDDERRGHWIYDAMSRFEPDLFVHTGDIVYYDKSYAGKHPISQDVPAARQRWNRMFAYEWNREFHRNVASYFLKDDHDTLKNDAWPGQTYGDLTWDQGLRLFREQTPQGELPYRSVRWGRDVQIWLLEGRDFRSANNMPDGPEKTLLGAEQKAWLKRTINESDATFKLVISPGPIVGPDKEGKNDNLANEGFQTEGDEIRRFLAGVPNLFVICGDRHWQYASRDFETSLLELGCGPINAAHAEIGGNPGERDPHLYFGGGKGGCLMFEVTPGADESAITFKWLDADRRIGGQHPWINHELRFSETSR